MSQFKSSVGVSVLFDDVVFKLRTVDGEWESRTASEVFKGKNVVVFGLPGAFTPTCSSSHLPRYEELYELFEAQGVDEVYCLSVNDTFVMNAWGEAQGAVNVKMLPDGNGAFVEKLGLLVDKGELGFGKRSWRFSMQVIDGVVVHQFIEPVKEGDPFEVSDADTMLGAIAPTLSKPYLRQITLFTKKGCPFCKEVKAALKVKGLKYAEIVLTDDIRQSVLSGITGKARPTVPVAFIDGSLVEGSKEIVNKL